MEGHLWKIIQAHLDAYGVREAEFARRIGTSPQTVSSWKKRGIRKLPEKKLLVGVSDVTRHPYDLVLDAVLHDIKYLPKEQGHAQDEAPITRGGGSPPEDPPAPGVTPLRRGDPEPPTQEEIDAGEVAADSDREGDT